MERTISKIIILCVILLSGCQTFYKIDTDELPEISNEDVIQIKFVNGETAIIDSIQNINITNNLELEIIQYSSTSHEIDSVRILYPLNEIEEIRIQKLDSIKSIFSYMWITIGVAFAVLVVFTIIYGPLKF